MPDPKGRERLISRFDLEVTQPDWALATSGTSRCAGPGDRVLTTTGDGVTGDAAMTPSQTGALPAIGMPWPTALVVQDGTPGAITISGRVLDAVGEPVPDALIETWQAGPDGRFAHPEDPRGAPARGAPGPGFRGFGRCPTDPAGRYRIVTLRPGPLPCPDGGTEAPGPLGL